MKNLENYITEKLMSKIPPVSLRYNIEDNLNECVFGRNYKWTKNLKTDFNGFVFASGTLPPFISSHYIEEVDGGFKVVEEHRSVCLYPERILKDKDIHLLQKSYLGRRRGAYVTIIQDYEKAMVKAIITKRLGKKRLNKIVIQKNIDISYELSIK